MVFVWKKLLCTACLVENFPLQIVRWRIFLQIYLGRILPSTVFWKRIKHVSSGTVLVVDFCFFFVVVYFENCFVQTPLQRVAG